ncbi:NUDIX hydrolase [Candidatus Jidaibacter acanthamoeba]|uniref:NUDIX hydrolase n=1 Tax=Candidatus Jidaibacter acanthamoebae TaxID=86105 RepID=A0A0C1MXB3_9RICK|nr:NUDIX hydrolase [Candidatus Jidaibacter acanthamoeba]KIE04511.1 NUDIX hydrolase [Candidatus Jidaibacter acanthamoeba]
MHRKKILELLNDYTSHHIEEVEYKNQIISFIKQNSDCFDRSNKAGHLTASAWLLNRSGDKALLMHHAKLNSWVQPGGHCDNDPDIISVALKEAKEESGINGIELVSHTIFDIDIHYIPAFHTESSHNHYDIRFLLQVKSNEEVKINHESKELRWVSKDISELPTDSKSIIRMFNKWIYL